MSTDVAKFSKGYKGKVGRTPASEAEHTGRVPQPGVPTGPRNAPKAEVTAATAPTVVVSSTGKVTTENFGPTGPSPAAVQAKRAAHKAVVKERQSQRRVKKVRTYVDQRDKELAPKREVKVSKGFLDKAASPKPITVAAHSRKLPGQEAPRAKPVKVAEHQRALPAQAKLKGTPQQRQVIRSELKQAKRQVIKGNTVTGPLTPTQKQMAVQISRETGLKPKTVATQELQEESGSAAQQREAEGNFDALNIGYYDSGPGALTQGSEWSNPRTAAKATSEFFKGQKYGPSEGIKNILPAAKGKPVAQQLQTIGESGWATSEYAKDLAATSALVGEKSNPKALKNFQAAATKAKSLGMKVGPALPDVQADAATHTIKVKASAKGAVEWAESQINVQENSGKQLKWAANFGLEAGGPWCANMVSNNLARRGFDTSSLPANPNYTPSYEEWGAAGKYAKDIGTDISQAKPGDILTFSGDHTAMYAGNGEMISGNFSDEVMKTPVSEGPAPLSMIIRPDYKGGIITVKESTPLPGTTSATGTLTGSAAPAAVSVVSSTNTAPEKPKNGKPVEGKRLTPFQELTKRVKKLQGLGVEVALPGHESKAKAANKPGDSALHQQLAALEAKYKVGAV